MNRLARAIEAIGEQDRLLVEENARVDRLRVRGAVELHAICRSFVDALNGRLAAPAVVLDPADFTEASYSESGVNLFQINLRGRLLQIEFEATEGLSSTEDFSKKYTMYGTLRAFNQDLLDHSSVNERSIFYCTEKTPQWHFLDCRSYRTGRVTEDFLASELERLL